MNKCICAIAAEYEIHYLDEWIDWHLKLGFDHMTIYCNNWSITLPESDSRVQYIPFDGLCRQLPAYNDFLFSHKQDYDWIGFLDIDEFVVLKKYDSLDQMFQLHSTHPTLALNWKLFGSNGLTDVADGDYSVIGRFNRSQVGVNQHVKTFVNCAFCRGVNVMFNSDPHHTNLIGFSPEGISFRGPFNQQGSDEKAYLAHFLTKSKSECIARRSKPRSDCGIPRDNLEQFFTAHDCNSVLNLDLQNYWKCQ